jgi:histidinol-phosphate/aromatic aminotransferase/cobyric acid decarboxylase-like protein/GNAT superfamily N-acetyltransferase
LCAKYRRANGETKKRRNPVVTVKGTPSFERKRHRLAVARPADREAIYELRHKVYALELRQHGPNDSGRLTDSLDAFNDYLCAWDGERLLGFISITPPGGASYSLDKYVARELLPFPVDDQLYEVRVLTVIPEARGREVAALLMYAALRWIESRGGTRIAAIGRHEVLGLYRKAGLRATGIRTSCGAVTFEVLHATTAELRAHLDQFEDVVQRLENNTDWQLDIAFRRPARCFHGGAFFRAIGERFENLERRHGIINADVLDAWFPPSPSVLAALQENLPWLVRTSPPTDSSGLIEVIAECRGVLPQNILPGAGSSDLIFRAFRTWLDRSSRVLLLDPTYGEYAHVLERIIRCHVDRLALDSATNYALPPERLAEALARDYDLAVLVNPNSPTGHHLRRAKLLPVLENAPRLTRIWIDETYVEYAGSDESMEVFAARSENVIVCKSMSKVYALSGVRAAYLCAAPHQLETLRALTPPWIVGLPAQVAAVRALQDPAYYAGLYAETHRLRRSLASQLAGLGWKVVPGCANFLLAHLPASGPTAAELVESCRSRDLFLRDAANMSARFGNREVRIAVKDEETNGRIIEILGEVLSQSTRIRQPLGELSRSQFPSSSNGAL